MKNWKTQFLIIYLGQAFSLIGSAAVQFSVIWWLTDTTESALTLTLATIVAFVPYMIVGPFAGAWVDRYNRKRVIMLADGFVALSSVALGLMFLLMSSPPIWAIYLILFLRGLGNTFHSPAMSATIPMLVPPEMLTKAGGWSHLVTSGANMLGPVLGAAMMAVLPVASIMLVDIGGAVIAIICLLFVRVPNVKQEKKLELLGDIKQGFSVLLQNKPLMSMAIPFMMLNIIFAPLGALFPLMVKTHFMGNAWHNSVVELSFAAGMLISSLVIGIWGGMRRRFLMAALSIVALGVFTMSSGLMPPAAFWGFVILSFFTGAMPTFMSVPVMAYIQETTPTEMMGKVMSLMSTAMVVATPIGLLVAGPMSELVGVGAWFVWSGLALVLTGVAGRLASRRYDTETLRPEVQG